MQKNYRRLVYLPFGASWSCLLDVIGGHILHRLEAIKIWLCCIRQVRIFFFFFFFRNGLRVMSNVYWRKTRPQSLSFPRSLKIVLFTAFALPLDHPCLVLSFHRLGCEGLVALLIHLRSSTFSSPYSYRPISTLPPSGK